MEVAKPAAAEWPWASLTAAAAVQGGSYRGPLHGIPIGLKDNYDDRQSAYVPDVIPDSDLAMYRKANFGHPIGWGHKIGIVVVDMTRAFVEDRFELGSAKMGQRALHGISRHTPAPLSRDSS